MDVIDNPGETRFELRDGGHVLGIAVYRKRPGLIAFTHTEVEDGHEGEGLGGTLVEAALESARDEGLAVLPFCPFVLGYIERHPEFRPLVPEHSREHFGL